MAHPPDRARRIAVAIASIVDTARGTKGPHVTPAARNRIEQYLRDEIADIVRVARNDLHDFQLEE